MIVQGIDLSLFVPDGGIERHDVRHICPECGGSVASETGLILVQICWACHGVGMLDNDGMDRYQDEIYRRAGVIR